MKTTKSASQLSPNLNILTRTEAAEILRISRQSLDMAVRAGEISLLRMGNNRGKILFRLCDIEAFAASRLQESVHAA